MEVEEVWFVSRSTSACLLGLGGCWGFIATRLARL